MVGWTLKDFLYPTKPAYPKFQLQRNQVHPLPNSEIGQAFVGGVVGGCCFVACFAAQHFSHQAHQYIVEFVDLSLG